MMNDELYLFYELIKESSAKSILDVGMVLDRYGILSRDHEGFFIDKSIRLDGVFPKNYFEISKTIYDTIYNDFTEISDSIKYELGFFWTKTVNWRWAKKHCQNFVTTILPPEYIPYKTISLSENPFYLCMSKENS